MIERLHALLRRRRRFLLFCLVGGSGVVVNMVVYVATLAVLDPSGNEGLVPVNVALVLGWLVSVASNFVLNDRLTFRAAGHTYQASGRRRLARYYSSASVALVLQAGIVNGLLLLLDAGLRPALGDAVASLGVLGAPLRLALSYQRIAANLIGIGFATVANYLLAKHWVFRAATSAADDEDDAPEDKAVRR